MNKVEYDEKEEYYLNRFLNMIATEYNGGLARDFEKYWIAKDKEIERLKEEKESWKRVATKNFNEAEDYKSIIKEVREMAEEKSKEEIGGWSWKILEILNKGE